LILEARHLSRWHGDVIAVNDADFTLERGITGILGPNGSGKSTLMRMAVGLQRPSQGSVRTLLEDPWDNPRLLKRIGYVPEGRAPWQELPGREAVVRAATLTGMSLPEATAAADEALAACGLTAASGRRVASYSHGMQQRLKFAIATAHKPELLVLDEPLLGTDPLARRDLIEGMRRFAAGGGSILLSTHVLPDVEALTERVLLLHHCRVLAHGPVPHIRDLLDRHPRTIRIGTTAARELGARLLAWPSVLSVQPDATGLTVRTGDPAAFHAQLQDLLADGSTPFSSIHPQDESLDAVFQYLVG
jgi:ABC-2 type transport system ATP-binding protein